MILVIGNYDSFTYNLVQYLGELNVNMQVHRNDQISLDQIRELRPDRAYEQSLGSGASDHETGNQNIAARANLRARREIYQPCAAGRNHVERRRRTRDRTTGIRNPHGVVTLVRIGHAGQKQR